MVINQPFPGCVCLLHTPLEEMVGLVEKNGQKIGTRRKWSPGASKNRRYCRVGTRA